MRGALGLLVKREIAARIRKGELMAVVADSENTRFRKANRDARIVRLGRTVISRRFAAGGNVGNGDDTGIALGEASPESDISVIAFGENPAEISVLLGDSSRRAVNPARDFDGFGLRRRGGSGGGSGSGLGGSGIDFALGRHFRNPVVEARNGPLHDFYRMKPRLGAS